MHHVFAYLDAGTGSLLIQGAIAAVIAVPVIFRNKISQIVRAVRGGHTDEVTETVAEPTTTDTPAR